MIEIAHIPRGCPAVRGHGYGTPSKLTTSFASGRPTLATVMRDSATARVIERSGAVSWSPWATRGTPCLDPPARGERRRSAELAVAGVDCARTAIEPKAALGRAPRFPEGLVSAVRRQ